MGILSLRLKCVSLYAIFVIVTVSFKLLSSLFFADYVYHQVKVENLSTPKCVSSNNDAKPLSFNNSILVRINFKFYRVAL